MAKKVRRVSLKGRLNEQKTRIIYAIMKKKGIKQMKVGNMIYDSTI